MANAKKSTTYILELDFEEAAWLKACLQNPVDFPDVNKHRESIFRALQDTVLPVKLKITKPKVVKNGL